MTAWSASVRGFRWKHCFGQAMIARYGYAAPKTRDALLRASNLIEESADSSRKFAVLYGISASHYVAGELVKQRSAAAEFLKEAEQSGNPATKSVGHRLMGTTHLTMGELAAGVHHLNRAWELYDSEQPFTDINMGRISGLPRFAI
jgi:hypothetical protein